MQTFLAFITGSNLLWAGLFFGFIFGMLLHRGGVTDFNVIVKQFLFRDFTVLKVMFTAIVVGGVGLFILHGQELSNWHIKPANMLAVILGALLFGIGMVIYGYCPGTGIAAVATGRLDALVGFLGMLVGGAAYALCYECGNGCGALYCLAGNVCSAPGLGHVGFGFALAGQRRYAGLALGCLACDVGSTFGC